jgi:DNA repair exonuclease SbcCD nuclease subunit
VKIAIFSDLHIHAWAEHAVDDRGVPSRLRHCVSVLRSVREHCVEHEIGIVLFGGDLFHKRGVLYTLPYNLAVEELAEWRRSGLRLCANVGNHDLADQAGKVHALQALESAGLLQSVPGHLDGWANWLMVDEDGGGRDVVVTAVAYCPGAAELRRRTDAALASRPDGSDHSSPFTVGLFHHGFRGARVGTSLEYMIKEDADPDAYSKSFDVMLSGHYHAHQEIGTQGNAWYVGSPMEFVRGETSPKGFLVLDTEAAEIERVDLDLPRFVKLTGAQIGDDDFDVEAHVSGNYVDVTFDELPMPWESVEATLRKLGAAGVRACPLRADKLPKSSRLDVDPTVGDRQLLEVYMEHVGVDPSERDDLLRTGLELLEEAAK